MSRFRHPSPALIIACIALLLALTGSAVAAGHFVITSTKEISPKVLRALKGKRGPRGYRGPVGPNGTPGTPGSPGTPGTPGTTATDLKYYGEVTAGGVAVTGVGDNFTVSRVSTGVYQLAFPPSIAPADLRSDGSNGCPVLIATSLTDGITAVAQPTTCTYTPGIGFMEDVDTINNSADMATNGGFSFIALPNH